MSAKSESKTYQAYEEVRGRANLGAIRLAVLLAVFAFLFPLGCWLASPGVMRALGAGAVVPVELETARWVMGCLFLAVCGLLAHGAFVEGRCTALLNEEAERLRWQLHAEEDRPSPAGGGGLHPAGGRGGSGCEAGDGLLGGEASTGGVVG